MLSTQARSLLSIPPGVRLPNGLEKLYDTYFAGRSYRTRFGEGWSFSPRGCRVGQDGLDCCVEHRTAQYTHYLDSELRVYVLDSGPIQIASNFVSLVERDAVLVGSRATGRDRRGLGTFSDRDEFLRRHGDYVKGWSAPGFTDEPFMSFFIGPSSVISLQRFYSDEYLLCAIEYY